MPAFFALPSRSFHNIRQLFVSKNRIHVLSGSYPVPTYTTNTREPVPYETILPDILYSLKDTQHSSVTTTHTIVLPLVA